MTAMYAAIMVLFALGLRRLHRNVIQDPEHWPSVSVIMPASNEAEVLPWTLWSLMRQDYPGKWEVIVVDDRSDDNTQSVLSDLQSRYPNLRSVRIDELSNGSPKKRALSTGIAASDSEVIFTTDADCQYHREWIKEMVRHLNGKTAVVAGLTIFDLPDFNSSPRWQKIQWLDFFVQNFLAAGALGWGHAASCNGSNLCFKRSVYDDISGYGNTADIVSGDDVLFAQRVAKLSQYRMAFSISQETLVRSLPVNSFGGLLNQRLRWASKGLSYRGSMLLFLFAIYAYYLMLIVLPVAAVFKTVLVPYVLAIWGLKMVVDTYLVKTGCSVFRQNRLLPYFPEYEFWHTFATPFFGIAGLLMPYRWKGDWYRTATLPSPLRHRWLRNSKHRETTAERASTLESRR